MRNGGAAPDPSTQFSLLCLYILDLADDAETGETYVVYKTLYGEYRDFIRPLDMFLSEVDHDKYPDVRQKWRFEKTAGLCSWNPAISSQYLKK